MRQRRILRTVFVTSILSTVFGYSYPSYAHRVLTTIAEDKTACTTGVVPRCAQAGRRIWESAPQDKSAQSEALMFFDRACRSGYSPACGEYVASRVKILNQDIDEYSLELAKDCSQKNAAACCYHGILLVNHSNLFKKRKLPTEVLGRIVAERFGVSCGAEYASGCTELGLLLNKASKVAEAEPYLRKACYLGDAYACVFNPTRDALKADAAVRRDLFYRGCMKNEPLGCFYLASTLEVSKNAVERNDANTYHTKACELGIPKSCVTIALTHIKRGDLSLAIALLDQPCQRGDGGSCLALANAKRLIMDPYREYFKLAAERFEEDCQYGDSQACLKKEEAKVSMKDTAMKSFWITFKYRLAIWLSGDSNGVK